MAIEPEAISAAGLPRGLLGGYKAGPTRELLKRVAWNYRQLLHDCERLAETVDELTSRMAHLEARGALGGALQEGQHPADVAGNVLATAQRTAHGLLEAARVESEAMLSDALSRSRKVEAEAQTRSGDETPGPAELRALDKRIRDELRATLESLLALGQDAAGDATAPPQPRPAVRDASNDRPPRS